MLVKDKFISILEILKKHFLMPFCLSTFIVSLIVQIFESSSNTLYGGLTLGFYAFFLWFKNLDNKSKIKNIIIEFSKNVFICTLVIFTVSKFYLPLKSAESTLFILVLLYTGILTLYSHSEPLPKNIYEEKNSADEINTKKWFYPISVLVVAILFLGFGFTHLGKFMSVDEPKWVNTRVPQLFEALKDHDWTSTYINDKPGILPAFLSGPVNLFLNHETFKSDPIHYENYLFWWRLPILVFNFLMLFAIYHFTKKLLDKKHALLVTGLIALNPILIGISQIVNPDSILWSLGFLAFLTFFLYLKTNIQKYIIYSGVFLGLALLCKYFASILYIIFFLTIYIEYLIGKINYTQLFKRFIDFFKLILISMIILYLFFPATWINPTLVIQNSIGSNILKPGYPFILILMIVIFTDLIPGKSVITSKVIKKIEIKKLIIYLYTTFFLFCLLSIFINLVTNDYFFNFNNFISEDFTRGTVNLVNTTMASIYTTIMTLTYPLLFGILSTVLLIRKKFYTGLNNNIFIIIASIFITVIVFTFGSSLGGYIALTRYQILLYPLFTLLFSLAFFFFYKKNLKILLIASFCLNTLSIIFSFPFYYHFNNILNIKNYLVTEAWGYGGYELAKIANILPDAKNTVVWSDREGFNEFFIGKSYWKGQDDPFNPNLNVKYLILSNGGEKVFRNALKKYQGGEIKPFYNRLAGETDLLEYYKKDTNLKICIDNNPSNCIRMVQLKPKL